MQSSNTATLSFMMPNIAHLCQSKLDDNNYLIWVFQFEPILKTNGLMGIVDGSVPCPPKLIPSSLNKTTFDVSIPKYILWEKKDQCILSWFITTLTTPLVPTIVVTQIIN
jgi:hypothetical protein